MSVYYNEFDRNAAAWLRELIRQGHLPVGEVDERSIKDVAAADLAGFDQCHFFAGIGGWPYALSLAGWHGPVWTGSCPCQPFSAAGKRRGTDDERHLWPEFRRLIADGRPPVVFGEQVASKDGRLWLAGIRADLEALGYGVGAADLCAAGVGAPHIRQRLYWLADAECERARRHTGDGAGTEATGGGPRGPHGHDCRYAPIAHGSVGGLADAEGWREHGEIQPRERKELPEPVGAGIVGGLVDAEGEQEGLPGRAWQSGSAIDCLDGKARRFEPGAFPLAHGVPARVGRLRGYGNAIVPQVAAEFVGAYMEGFL